MCCNQYGYLKENKKKLLSIEYLVKGIVESRGEGKTIVEESPVQSHASNGVVERAVQEIEGGIRAVYLGLEDRIREEEDRRQGTHNSVYPGIRGVFDESVSSWV